MPKTSNKTGLVGWARRSHVVLALTAISSILITLAATSDAVDKIAVRIGLKPSALQLAADDARARFSRELLHAAWYRHYLMFRYVALVRGNNPDGDKEKVWSKYTEVLEEWNGNRLINELSLKQFYGEAKRDEFTRHIQPEFTELHSCLEGLRMPTSSFRCPLSPQRDIAAIEKALGRLQHDIRCFAEGFPDLTSTAETPPPAKCFAGG